MSNSTTANSQLLEQILTKYNLNWHECKITKLGNGLINDTFLVQHIKKSIVLQRINQQVFTQPLQVIENTELICQHLKQKHLEQDYSLQPIWQHLTVQNDNYVYIEGQYWRALTFVEGSYTIEAITNAEQAKIVAQAYAQFSLTLADFDSTKLKCIIPSFHHLPTRISQLNSALASASQSRKLTAKPLINDIFLQQSFIDEVETVIRQLPQRVTHNDTKINNLLFNKETDQAIAVIDLDTCMSGYLMHDFGDMVRSCCSSLAEDDKNIEAMVVNTEYLAILATTYVEQFAFKLSKVEQQSLIIGVKLMPFMLGIRFLTDYLNNDCYFHTEYTEHNLIRAKNQLHLYRLFQNESTLLKQLLS